MPSRSRTLLAVLLPNCIFAVGVMLLGWDVGIALLYFLIQAAVGAGIAAVKLSATGARLWLEFFTITIPFLLMGVVILWMDYLEPTPESLLPVTALQASLVILTAI